MGRLTKRQKEWHILEDTDNCIVSFKCPKCSHEFSKQGRELQKELVVRCGRCDYVRYLDNEGALRLITEQIDKVRKTMESLRGKLSS